MTKRFLHLSQIVFHKHKNLQKLKTVIYTLFSYQLKIIGNISVVLCVAHVFLSATKTL